MQGPPPTARRSSRSRAPLPGRLRSMQPSDDDSSDDLDPFTHEAFNDDALPLASSLNDPHELKAALAALCGAPRSSLRSAPDPASDKSSALKRGLRQRYSDDLVLRLYDETPCTTLLVSFCSLAEGDAAEHEWIGTAKRALMTHILCLCDPIRAWYLRGTTPE